MATATDARPTPAQMRAARTGTCLSPWCKPGRCEGWVPGEMRAGYRECECGHTQDVHARADAKRAR